MGTMFFYSIFFFSWFIYAAFVGLGISLYRFARPVSLWFLIVSLLIVVSVLITFWNQHFFATPGTINSSLSVLAFIGFAVALGLIKRLPFRKTQAAFFICCGALCVCLWWGFVGWIFFLPLLFMPDAQLLFAHVVFSAFFLTVGTGSYFYFQWTWKRQERESVATVEGTNNNPINGLVRFKVLVIKSLKVAVLSYIFGLFVTIVFGCPAVRDLAVKSMELPEPRQHFQDTTGGGLTSGRHYYSCSAYSFIPFCVGVAYRWKIQDPSHKPELTRGLDGQEHYIWIPAVCAIKISGKTHPFEFFTNGHRYVTIPK